MTLSTSTDLEDSFLTTMRSERGMNVPREIFRSRGSNETALRQEEAEAEYERQRALADQADANGGYEQVQGVGSTGLLLAPGVCRPFFDKAQNTISHRIEFADPPLSKQFSGQAAARNACGLFSGTSPRWPYHRGVSASAVSWLGIAQTAAARSFNIAPAVTRSPAAGRRSIQPRARRQRRHR